MPKMQTLTPKSRVSAQDIQDCIVLFKMLIQGGQAYSPPPVTAPARHTARFKNKETHQNCLDEGKLAEGLINTATKNVLGVLTKIDDSMKSGTPPPLTDDEIAGWGRDLQYWLQELFAKAANLHCAGQCILNNIEFLHKPRPHPCNLPPGQPESTKELAAFAVAPGYEWSGAGEAHEDEREQAEARVKQAEQGRYDAERMAEEVEARLKQAEQGRYDAERRAEATEARTKQAEQGRSDAERMAEEAAKNREVAQLRAAELEERLRQHERDQTEPGAEAQPTERTSSAKRRSPGRKRRGGRSES